MTAIDRVIILCMFIATVFGFAIIINTIDWQGELIVEIYKEKR